MEKNNKMESHTKQNLIKAVKFILLVCSAFFAGLALVFAMGVDSRLAADEGILRDVSSSLSEVNRKLDNIPQAGVHDYNEPAESSAPAEEVPTYTQEELISMAVSDDFNNMMKVALYPEATESQLLFTATACAYSDSVEGETSAVRLATALLDHPNASKAVVSTLAQTKSPVVWLLVAQSELCSESTLAVLADNCINVSFGSNKDDLVVAVASAICENDAVTEDVLNMFGHTSNSYIRFIVDTKLGNFPKP